MAEVYPNTGVITAKNKGTAFITAVYSGKSVSFKVNITYEINSFELVTPLTQLDAGKTLKVKAVLYYENGRSEDVTAKASWESNSQDIASVKAGIVKGLGKGDANIKATLIIGKNSYTSNVKITVTPALIKLAADPIVLKVNATAVPVIYAIYTGDDKQPVPLENFKNWRTSNRSIAVIDSNDNITGVKKGTATITAVYGSLKISIKVTVVE